MGIRGVSTALYGWMERFAREGIEWDWDSLYGACADAGVDAVETDPFPEKLAILHRLGLQVSSSYVGIPLTVPFGEIDLDGRILPTAERLAGAGGTTLLLNADPIDWTGGAGKTVDEAKLQGENISRIAEHVKKLGLETALHNHSADHGDAQRDLESVVLHASEEVGLCIDTGWAVVAGHDPIEWALAYPSRVLAFHLRTNAGDAPAEDLTTGEPEIDVLLDAVPDFTGWVGLELWHPPSMTPRGSMVDAVRRSAALVRSLRGSRPRQAT